MLFKKFSTLNHNHTLNGKIPDIVLEKILKTDVIENTRYASVAKSILTLLLGVLATQANGPKYSAPSPNTVPKPSSNKPSTPYIFGTDITPKE